ncbi:hypothetical protein PCANB_001044 [Pneumocystis canis]|nr:hypothetical protein PCANB_001044 [Pneumocystis canis]
MWVLESNSNELNGIRRFLKPGKEYLVGRAKYITDINIDCKSVSKRHAKISVEMAQKGSSLLLEEKIGIYITDLGSRFGTIVNGEQLKNVPKRCDQNSQEIIFAKCQGKFRLSWNPIVFTLSGVKLKDIQPLIEAYGIKITKEYCEKTTHVISRQRNTAKNLQALIYGALVVTSSYVQELVQTIGLVELNFDYGFPNPQKHIPPNNAYSLIDTCPGDFLPNKHRRQLFNGLTFIFFDKKQYYSLSPPINAASGKTVFCYETSDIEQIVLFIQNYPNAIAISPLHDSHYIDIASKRLFLDEFLEPILKLDLSLFLKKSYRNSDSICLNNAMIDQNNVQECYNHGLNNVKYNSELSFEFNSELSDQRLYQIPPKCDIDVFSNNDIDNKQNIDFSKIRNDIFDKNDVLSQKALNSNKFIEKGGIMHQTSDKKVYIFYENIKANPMFDCPIGSIQGSQVSSDNNLNDIYSIHETNFQNTSNLPQKLPLNEKSLNKTVYEPKLYNCLMSNLSVTPTIKDPMNFSTLASQKNETKLFGSVENEPMESHFCNSSNKGENLKMIEYFKVELKPKKSLDISSRWDPKWDGRKNFKKFRKAQRTQPTYTQHIRLVEYKPEGIRFIPKSVEQKNNRQISKKNIENMTSSIVENVVFKNEKVKVFSKNIESYFDIIQDDSDDDPLKFRL